MAEFVVLLPGCLNPWQRCLFPSQQCLGRGHQLHLLKRSVSTKGSSVFIDGRSFVFKGNGFVIDGSSVVFLKRRLLTEGRNALRDDRGFVLPGSSIDTHDISLTDFSTKFRKRVRAFRIIVLTGLSEVIKTICGHRYPFGGAVFNLKLIT